MAGNILTKNEMIIMNVFWEVKKPLTSAELTDLIADKNWFPSYVITALRSLEAKGFVKVCGTVRHSTQYARQFVSTVSREEYAARLALTSGIKKNALADVTLALAREVSDDDADLQDILGDLINILVQKETNKGK